MFNYGKAGLVSAAGRKKLRATAKACNKTREVELMVLSSEVGGRDLPHSLTLDQFLEPSADRDFWPSCWNEACKIQRPACRSRFFVATLETTRVRSGARDARRGGSLEHSNPNLGKRLSLSHFLRARARMQTKSAWGEFASEGSNLSVRRRHLWFTATEALFRQLEHTTLWDDW